MNSKRNYKLNLYIINIKLIYKWVLLQRKKKSTNGQNRGFYRINLKQISRSWISSWKFSKNIFYKSTLSSKWSNLSISSYLVVDFIMILVGSKQGILLKYSRTDFFN